MVKCIGVLTSGGDAPGMNAAVRAVARTCLNKGIEVYGVRLGYKGLYEGDFIKFDRHSTRNIINLGGTFLKSARFPEFKDPEIRKSAIEQMKKVGMEALVVIGGDGSYTGALKLTEMGVNCIGIPGTIDNDIPNTDYTVGFDTALNTVVDALDRLRDTSSSHQRCTILEVMGRRCGDLAINAGIAAGAEMIITSEIGFDEEKVIERLKASKESDKKHAIVVITEHITDVHELAKKVGLKADSKEEGIASLIQKVQEMNEHLNIPKSLQDAGIEEQEFLAKVDMLADRAFEDQCTTANPRLPLVSELKQILLDSFYGNEI